MLACLTFGGNYARHEKGHDVQDGQKRDESWQASKPSRGDGLRRSRQANEDADEKDEMKSAAIIKTKTLAPWRELRLQKRKLKKTQAIERKATKVYYPSAMGKVEVVVIEEPTRDEMLEQADKIGLKVDKRWSTETLLNKLNEAMKWDTANASS